jgi:hypothetical protein
MRQYLLLTIGLLLLLEGIGRAHRPPSRGAKPFPEGKELAVFDSPEAIQKIQLHNARVSPVKANSRGGRRGLRIDFERAELPSASFPAGEKAWDWHAFAFLALDLSNPGNKAVAFGIRVDDDPSADGVSHSRTARGTIGAGQTQSFAMPLGPSDPIDNGMRGGPLEASLEPLRRVSESRLDLSHIIAFRVFLSQPPEPRTLTVANLHLLPPVSYDGIVDAFGQYTRADWPGKLKDETDFARRRADEEASIRGAPALPDRDEYGGWASGPRLEASGFFRTARQDGKWWLVTPDGHLFFSLGMDVISTQDGYTFVEGREKMFTWLPGPAEPLAKHYRNDDRALYGPIKKGRSFNFDEANLERQYGPDYLPPWRAMALDRLRAWGFNTIGNWSDPKLADLKRVPYVATIDISGDFARVSSGLDYWGKMPDPFDPRFATAAEESIREPAPKIRDDPWCLGYFIDNEISWGGGEGDKGHYGLAYGTLATTRESPAKAALLRQLKERYGEVERLNAAWGTRFPSWETLLDRPFEPQGALTQSMKEDFSAFLRAFARQYFRVIRDTLRRSDPSHLYLGCRFAWRTPEAVEAAAEFCEVVSFNIYQARLDPKEWDFVRSLNKPCIIGEFHFGALDRGMFHPGLVAAANQQARAEMYRDYVLSVIHHPAFVGCHWFQYFDEPLTGRSYDGENYNIGFVTVTDTPYPEMVAAAKAVHAQVYSGRAEKRM